jgi:hypothetical protein
MNVVMRASGWLLFVAFAAGYPGLLLEVAAFASIVLMDRLMDESSRLFVNR